MNRYAPHVYVIPEDDADRQLADGFVLHLAIDDTRIKVVPPAGGWANVIATFRDEYVAKLRDYPLAHIVMVVDFDGQVARRKAEFEEAIPDELKTRVFVIGPKLYPEALKAELKMSFEDIGRSLADDCDVGTTEYWDHHHLNHNEPDRRRLVEVVRPFLILPGARPS